MTVPWVCSEMSLNAAVDGQSRSLIQRGCIAALLLCRTNNGEVVLSCDWQNPPKTWSTSTPCVSEPETGCRVDRCGLRAEPDFAKVALGQWNLTLSKTVSALRGYSQALGSVQDRPGPSAPLSAPGLRSPSRRCSPPRPLCPLPAGLLLRRHRCSYTACTTVCAPVWGRGPPATATRGTRRCWRRRWRRWSAASPNTRKVTAEVTCSGDNAASRTTVVSVYTLGVLKKRNHLPRLFGSVISKTN